MGNRQESRFLLIFFAVTVFGGEELNTLAWTFKGDENKENGISLDDEKPLQNTEKKKNSVEVSDQKGKSAIASLEVLQEHVDVRVAPDDRTRRRGVLMRGARLPYFMTEKGPGCEKLWYKVYEDAWICGEYVTLRAMPPKGERYPIIVGEEVTPWSYGFVREPTIEYTIHKGELIEERDLLKGYGFGVQGYVEHNGIKYFKTVKGTLVQRQFAGVAGRISNYRGVELNDGAFWPMGFVNAKEAWVYSEPKKTAKYRVGKLKRYESFEFVEEVGSELGGFVRTKEGAWLLKRDVRVARIAKIPEGVAADEKWIDIDTDRQIVTAYVGEKPVYVTLVSTGRRGPSQTVKGTYRIWVKVAAIAMDNTDEELEEPLEEEKDAGVLEEHKLYSLQDVPWVQFFFENYGLHGVYWHDRFGNRKSHGCVNLSPRDARWFFDWTEPRLPDGWWAVHTSPSEKGTLVRVR